ncbi:hypothetical protein [Nocardia sp. NPDC057030]|uniref:hypothetical protein n=1 Tax=unclassified Nocardia TaxID=2637762 RepID=UPI00362AA072
MSDDQPEHQCRQGRRCKARVRDDDGEFHGKGVEGPGTLCRPCETDAFEAIRCLRADYEALRIARTEVRSHISGPKVSKSSERSIPIVLPVDTLMSDISLETLRWAVRITRGNPIPDDDCFAVLCANLGTLIDLPAQQVTVWVPLADGGDDTARAVHDGVDAVLRLAALHQRARKLLGLDEPRIQWLRESCHVCGYCTLTSSIADATITCKTCQNCWDQDEFARLNNPLLAVA